MKQKNEAAQAMARLSHAGPVSEKRKANARENGKKGGRPKKPPFASTLHRDGTVTIWNIYAQEWVRTEAPSDQILASLSRDERDKIEAHLAK